MAAQAKVTANPTADIAAKGHTDASILAGLERQEAWAAAALFDHLNAKVDRALYRVLQHRDVDFEDLVQITFERIVRTLVEHRFAAHCSLGTWASAIATNVAIDAVRAKVRERRIFSRESLDKADRDWSNRGKVTERMESRSEVSRLQTILGQMNPGQAEAVFLHDVMGYDLGEVALLAGISPAAAQSRLVRGRKDFLRRAEPGRGLPVDQPDPHAVDGTDGGRPSAMPQNKTNELHHDAAHAVPSKGAIE